MAKKKQPKNKKKTPKKSSPKPKKAAKKKAVKKSKPKKAAKPKKAVKKPAVKKVKAKKVKAKKVAKPKKAAKKPVVKKAKIKKAAKPKKTAKAKTKKSSSSRKSSKKSRVIRYSDKELNEFKKLILEKLGEAKKQLQEYQDQITRKEEHGTDDTENRFVSMEDGTSTIEREIASQMAVRTRQYLDNLEKALLRIQNKTYGICIITGKLISKDRLFANPIATKTIEAKNQEKKTIQNQPQPVYQLVSQEQETELE